MLSNFVPSSPSKDPSSKHIPSHSDPRPPCHSATSILSLSGNWHSSWMWCVWWSVDKWFLSHFHFHLYPKVTWHYEPISIQRVVHHQHQWGRVWTCQMLNVSTSSTPLAPSHSIRPWLYMLAITRVRLSRTMSVSRSWILLFNSTVSLLLSPSSFSICFLFSRSSFKRSISNSNMRSLTDDISTSNEMWQIQHMFISCRSCCIFWHFFLLLLLVSIYKPPIHRLFFQIRQLGEQLDLFQWRMLTCVVEISFQKINILLT